MHRHVAMLAKNDSSQQKPHPFSAISAWQLSMDLQWKQKWSAVLMTAKSIRNFFNLSKRKEIIYKTLRKQAERIKQW